MTKGIMQFAVGDQVDVFLLIKHATKGIASNGKPFLTLILQDKSGEIEAKLWDASEADEKSYMTESIVKVSGEILSYRGRHQLRIRQIRPQAPIDPVKMADFLETAPIQTDEMASKLTQYIFDMKNPNIQRITRHLLKKYQQDFMQFPAATKNHHEFISRSGLSCVLYARPGKGDRGALSKPR